MATIDSKDARQALYAVAGVADLAVSALRQLPAEAQKIRSRLPDEAQKLRERLPGEAVRAYGNLVQRGEALVSTLRARRPEQAGRATRVEVTGGTAKSSGPGGRARSTRGSSGGASTTVRRVAEPGDKRAE